MVASGKYGASKHVYKGRKFDSGLEMLRFIRLEEAQHDGKISELQCQVPFQLLPAQYKVEYVKKRGGEKEEKTLVEKSVRYTADFTYMKDGALVVEDTKGMRTEAYVLRRKLMYYIHGIIVREVNNPGEPI